MDIYGNFATKIFNATWFIAVKRRKQPKFLTTEHRLKGTNNFNGILCSQQAYL